ncbi:MAG: TolC family protein [Proteobacteria bacterium]|nr:TolC family protein [Pseudomonadota bacterium]
MKTAIIRTIVGAAALGALFNTPIYSAQGTEPKPLSLSPPAVPPPRRTDSVLTLDQAIDRVLDKHPDLRVFSYTEKSLRAAADTAAQSPPLMAGATIENALGTGEAARFNAAEITLTLASVLERGGKREARQALATSRIDALAMTREAKRLDLLAEVARRYLDVVAALAEQRIAALDLAQRERTLVAATQRVQAGASPESARLTADAMRARAELECDRARLETEAALRRLAILWGDRNAPALTVAGDPLQLAEVSDFETLAKLLERTPELERFAGEGRIREARLRLAQSARAPDIEWQIGVRRLQDLSAWGLIGSVSVPLGTSRRAEPGIREAESELDALSLERESSELTLYATLAQAHGQYRARKVEVERSRDEVLPRLGRAEAAAERAYRSGALSYLEWAQVQNETTAARKQQLAAALDAQRALIEIQRLTGESLVRSPSAKETTP